LRSEVRFLSLPAERDRLIGRDADVRAVVAALADHRLVTLTDVGGTVKTRLAIAAARERSPEHESTVFVDLAVIARESQVAGAAMAALRTMAPGQEPSPALIASVLGQRAVLILIDNAEHVLDSTAELSRCFSTSAPRRGCS
jgi:predicted ATPase